MRLIKLLRKQLEEQPRTNSGGFWHKKAYPNQMWLDGLYMGEPFYAQYTVQYENGEKLDDIAKQFELIQEHATDKKTGLLYHGWDESHLQKWANPTTGQSPAFWSRAMGWYMMGLVDVLDYIPKDHPRRPELIKILQRLTHEVLTYQDKNSGTWWQIMNKENQKDNYRINEIK